MNTDTAISTRELSLDEIIYMLDALTPLERAIVSAIVDLFTLLDEGTQDESEGA